jgi:hypothetical protein
MPDCVREKDCIKAPFGDECRKFCIESWLRTATVEEKRLVLGFTTQTANAIAQAYRQHPIANYDDLARHLSPSQQAEINSQFDSITQFQLDYFRLDSQQKKLILDTYRNLGSNLNNEEEVPVST